MKKEDIIKRLKNGETGIYADFIEDNPDFKLYKYRLGLTRDIEALSQDKLWMGCAANMDDVYDCGFQTAENWPLLYLLMCESEPKFLEEKYAKVMFKGGEVFQREMYVCSFGETPTNEDLWTRYADRHHGFCVEYSVRSLIEKRLVPLPVSYGDIKKSIVDFSDKIATMFDIFLVKDEEEWGQQAEWRILKWYNNLDIQPGEAGKLVEAPRPTALICGKCASKELNNALIRLATLFKIALVEEV